MLSQEELDRQIAIDTAKALAPRHARFDAMPDALRQFRAWGFYDDSKVPKSLRYATLGWSPIQQKRNPDPAIMLRVNDPSTWAPFDACRNAPYSSYCTGPSFVLAESFGLVCIDVDNPEKSLPTYPWFNDFDPANQAKLIARAHAVNDETIRLARESGMWIERSMSGKGWHVFTFAKLPHHTYSIAYGGNIFSRSRYIAMTGNPAQGSGNDIGHQQAGMEQILRLLEVQGVLVSISITAAGDPIDDGEQTMSDADVLAQLPKVNGASAEAYHGKRRRDWSTTIRNLVGDLAKITHNNAQVERIAGRSPLVLREPNKEGSNETRSAKFERLFPVWIAEARRSNVAEMKRRAEIAAENLRRFGGLSIR